MVNEFQYCPRLAYLEWVQGEWAESAETVEGRGVHRRIDRGPGALPEPEEISDDDRIHARSVMLSSERLGLIVKLDLIESEDGAVQPVDYKRGRRPHVPAGAYEPSSSSSVSKGSCSKTTAIAAMKVRYISARVGNGSG
jgi:CRISPR/Cas system-associated exonuclease Cas4 (RecB family)